MEFSVDVMVPGDWSDVQRIYGEGIATGQATFETAIPTREEWDRRHLADPRFVARSSAGVVGWAALGPVSQRAVYAGVAEVSVYVAAEARGMGVGGALLARLIDGSEARGIWMLQAGIFPENPASVRLHERHGFRVVGRRERIAVLHGAWRDVLLLERRSDVVGVDRVRPAIPSTGIR